MDNIKISEEQKDLINRFLHAYNSIEKHLKINLKVENKTSFTRLVLDFAERNPNWQHKVFLTRAAEVRNIYTHHPEKDGDHFAVPVQPVVEELEKIRDSLEKPFKIYPKFKKNVELFQTTDKLISVLKIINEKDYSQFPIYEKGKFVGLLTENGITRWLAKHAINILS
ncbi:MAG TPA: CBS domain-containing protein, partial [Anaerolineales bacterium]|nr:CBS domain-containing protein [Anaerolineales bacterium]